MLPTRGGVLLDLGCGNGAQTVYFAPQFQAVVGADVDSSFLIAFTRAVREQVRGGGAVGTRYDGHRLPLRDACVDYVTSFEVLEHVQSERDVLSELHRVLRPGGLMAISVPNRWWVFETHGASLPLLHWNRVPLFSWLPKRLHDRWAHARIYRKREIVGLLRAYGLEIRGAAYMTAPMDVIRWRPLRRLLRATLFRSDHTLIPFLSTAVLVVAQRPDR